MIEIIILYFLVRNIGQMAREKGESPGLWKFFAILAWIVFEIFGMITGVAFFDFDLSPYSEDIIRIMVFALACAFGGYLFVRSILSNRPGKKDPSL